MSWSPGNYQTKCGMKATVARLETKNKEWLIKGSILCPSSDVLAMSVWDVNGSILSVAGITTIDPDFDLTHEKYERKSA